MSRELRIKEKDLSELNNENLKRTGSLFMGKRVHVLLFKDVHPKITWVSRIRRKSTAISGHGIDGKPGSIGNVGGRREGWR